MVAQNQLHVMPRRGAVTPNTEIKTKTKFEKPGNCPLANCSALSMYESELERHEATEARLRRYVVREGALLHQKEKLIRQQVILSRESEHRLLNGLQLVTSLLSIQSRAAKNSEAAAQLKIAADRVTAIGRVHRHLRALDHVENVEFKPYLENLCRDLSNMTSSGSAARDLVVEGIALKIPSAMAIPLGFVANELITNAIKYAKGRIVVELRGDAENGYALSVSDDGPGLPDGFDPGATHGLGMKLVSSLVKQIDGKLQITQGDSGKGARFTVLFA